jgi:hypothetical protein
LAVSSVVRSLAADVTWRLVIASAPWAARGSHTSVIDAAGAIYVIGGMGLARYNDVWLSNDKGAEQSRAGTRWLLVPTQLMETRGTRGRSKELSPHAHKLTDTRVYQYHKPHANRLEFGPNTHLRTHTYTQTVCIESFDPAVFIAYSAAATREQLRALLRLSSLGSRALAAGVTWTSRTTSAPWAGRSGHTSVIDAAGAIYVIGGYGEGSLHYFQDVWASTDGGADRTRAGH